MYARNGPKGVEDPASDSQSRRSPGEMVGVGARNAPKTVRGSLPYLVLAWDGPRCFPHRVPSLRNDCGTPGLVRFLLEWSALVR